MLSNIDYDKKSFLISGPVCSSIHIKRGLAKKKKAVGGGKDYQSIG